MNEEVAILWHWRHHRGRPLPYHVFEDAFDDERDIITLARVTRAVDVAHLWNDERYTCPKKS